MRPVPASPQTTGSVPENYIESSLVSSDSTVRDSTVEASRESCAVRTFLPSNTASVKPVSTSASVTLSNQSLQATAISVLDTTGPRADKLNEVFAFSSVPVKTTKMYTIAKDVEFNITASRRHMHTATKAKPELKEAHAFLKRQQTIPEADRDQAKIDKAYQQMRLGRKDLSALEIYLANHPEFKVLLFAPSGGVRDTSTGLYAELRKVPGNGDIPEYVLCFPGTGCAGGVQAQWKTNVNQLTGIGGLSTLYTQALKLTDQLKSTLHSSGIRLSVTGHSLGGGIANFVGLALDLDSCCFNAAALGPTSLEYLDINGCLTPERVARQVHVRFSDDWAAHPGLMKSAKVLAKLAAESTGNLKASLVGQAYHLSPGDPHYPDNIDVFKRHQLVSLGTPLYQSTRSIRTETGSTSTTPVTNPPPTPQLIHRSQTTSSDPKISSGSTSDNTEKQE